VLTSVSRNATGQAFSRQHPTVEFRVRSLVLWDFWWTMWHWERYSSRTSVSPANSHSTALIYHPGPVQHPHYWPANQLGSRDSSVGISTGYGLDGWGSITGRGQKLFSTVSRPTVWPTQAPVQCVPGAQSGLNVKLTTHIHLEPKPRTMELYLHFPHMSPCVVLS
jgi:hypothetical protein